MEIFQLRAGEDFIRLGQVLKATGMAESGAEAKEIIQDGLVSVAFLFEKCCKKV